MRQSSRGTDMRKAKETQMKLGEVSISEISLDPNSRDDIPKILFGLQYIHNDKKLLEKIFLVLRGIIPEGIAVDNGRPGMDLWKILVLGVLRLGCNWDYDRLQEMANKHKDIRRMLGHGLIDQDDEYALQTLKDNISLFNEDVLDKINQLVVKAGLSTLPRIKNDEDLKGRCDSFVVETNVHFPTDINLLFDAVGKVITMTSKACAEAGIAGWRQGKHNLKKIKKLYRKVQKLKRSNSKDEKKKAQQERLIIEAYETYVRLVQSFLSRVEATLIELKEKTSISDDTIQDIYKYRKHAEKLIGQIHRRVINKEIIPHDEKIFSVFEEHTEWIIKGKAGVPQELGLRVCIMESKGQFVLHHKVMINETDDKAAESMVKGTKERYPAFNNCSFDKGFHSQLNQRTLLEYLDELYLPRKGRLSERDKEREYSEEFVEAKRRHSAVESAINALEQHGLDRCPDHGLIGFKRYVALGVLARNIHLLGTIIQRKQRTYLKRCAGLERAREKVKLLFAA